MTELIVGTTIFSATGGVISSWPSRDRNRKFFCRIVRPDGETWFGSESRHPESPEMVVLVERLLLSGEGLIIVESKNKCAVGEIIAPRAVKKKLRCKENGCDGEICDEGLFREINNLNMRIHPCKKCGRAYPKGGKPISGKMGTKIFLRNGEIFSGDLVPGQK